MSGVYRSKRPLLTVERVGGGSLGNCYHYIQVKVIADKRLSKEQLSIMRENGLLGSFGQGFSIKSACDGSEEAAFYEEVPCLDEETGEPWVNPYSNKESKPIKVPFYEYLVEHRIDSSG